VISDSFSVVIKSPQKIDFQEQTIRSTLYELAQSDYFSSAHIKQLVQDLLPGRLSKFQPFLPSDLEEQFLADRLFDVAGLLYWLKKYFLVENHKK
jgi:hypothetical protein